MDKQRSTQMPYRPQNDPRQARRGIYPANHQPPPPLPPNRSGQAIPILLGGLILLQVITLVAALVVAWPDHDSTNPQERVVVLPTSVPATPSPVPTPVTPPYESSPQPSVVLPTPSISPTDEGHNSANPPKPPALKLRGLEITQGIQVFNEPELPRCNPNPTHPDYIFCNNSIPLVAGRHTLVRVYPACSDSCPTTDTVVRLRLFKDGQEKGSLTRSLPAATLQQINTLAMPELRLSLDKSVNFEFFPPPDWLVGQVSLAVEALPQGEMARAPATLTLVEEFAVRKPLRVAYLPITYQGLAPAEPANVDYWLARMYPVPGVQYYRLPVPDLTWEGELNKGEILRKLLYTYWLYVQSQPAEKWPDQLFGWLPQQVYNGGASDPAWCSNCTGAHSSRVAFGGVRPELDIGGPRILAHEIAHNLGALHAWSPTQREDAACFKAEGADIWVDPDWPYAQTPHIQEVGIDLYSNPAVIYPPSVYDMMAYCSQPWISPYSYRKIFNSPLLQPDLNLAQPLTFAQPQPGSSRAAALVVSGVIYPDGTVSQPEVVQLDGSTFAHVAGFNPPPGDDYCLEVQANDQTSLARYCFEVGFVDVETGLPATEPSPFFITLPDVDPHAAAKVTLSKNQIPVASLTPSDHSPQISLVFPTGGETLAGLQTITWQANDADGGSLVYDLLYSSDKGQSWFPLAVRLHQTQYTLHMAQLPGGPAGIIRVIASDGFHSDFAQSDIMVDQGRVVDVK